MAEAAVYYTVAQPRTEAGEPLRGDYLAMLINSVRSLRALSPSVPVYCVLFGSFPGSQVEELASLGATVIRRPAPRPDQFFILKFLGLEAIEERTVLFLDADTYLFEPVERIWEQHTECSFYAKVEWGCDRAGPNAAPGECNWPMMDLLADELGLAGAKRLPLYNNGVMLFNRHFHRGLLGQVPLLASLRDRFASGDLPYPHHYNRHIVGEIATLFALGAFPMETFGVFAPGACTFWQEHELDPGKPWGIVCHTFTDHYRAFLERLPGALEQRGAQSGA